MRHGRERPFRRGKLERCERDGQRTASGSGSGSGSGSEGVKRRGGGVKE